MLNSRIAIIEDEAPLRAELMAFFELKQVQVFGYASAEDFFKALPLQSFDLVIMDIGLPGMSGIEAANAFRQQSNAPVLILTSHANHDTHLDSLNAGADVFLSKTAPLEIIESSVRNLLARALNMPVAEPTKQAPVSTPATSAISQGNQRKADQALWRLFVSERLLKAPNHIACQLTFAETLFLKSVFDNGGEAVSRAQVIKVMGKEETLSNLRNLDTYANRIRRKVLETTSVELPLRSAYNIGYSFTGRCHVLP